MAALTEHPCLVPDHVPLHEKEFRSWRSRSTARPGSRARRSPAATARKLGNVDALYYDTTSHDATWAAVRTGLFGTHVSLVPLGRASMENDEPMVPFDKDALKSAPHHDPGRELSPRDEQDLFRHYGMGDGGVTHQADGHTGTGRNAPGTAMGTAAGKNGDATMTRSEEQLRVGTETHETGRPRLRKRVVTEHQTVQVPVSHEEVHVERAPITDADRHRGATISEQEHEVTLHEERAVVSKETVPVEQVRLRTEAVRGTEEVGGDLRHEEIEVDKGDNRGRDTRR
ncbi:YsnF/AvaK domain-containing protein [Pseudonocardia sp. GCM10023141]|uniref:YsnF/AvaK domain-containing protein n=1 Tax=Pseudonocardia sp. GCM10023141 TaxID=3252653 RepID=UPI00361D7078